MQIGFPILIPPVREADNSALSTTEITKSRRYTSTPPFTFKLLLCEAGYVSIFIHLVVCLTTGPDPSPKRALHIVRSRSSFFKWEYPLLSLRSCSSFLRLLPCLPVTSIPPCIFPSITRCRRQFLRKMWLIQFVFRLRISCRIFLCSCVCVCVCVK